MFYALFYNKSNDEIEVYPKLDSHSLTEKDIESYLSQLTDAKSWTIYDHLPTEDDINDFEEICDEIQNTTDEENNNIEQD